MSDTVPTTWGKSIETPKIPPQMPIPPDTAAVGVPTSIIDNLDEEVNS